MKSLVFNQYRTFANISGSVNGVQVPNGGPIPMMHPSDRRSPSPVEAGCERMTMIEQK